MVVVKHIEREHFDAIESIAKALHPQWFTESALREIAHAIRMHNGFVALRDGRIVGFATYLPNNIDRRAELTWIGVIPELHRRGIGQALVEAIAHELAEKGFQAIEVSTLASTVEYEPYARTRNFYHAVGFADVSVEKNGFPNGDDKLLLRRPLSKRSG